jgi:hypothetical protein
MELNNREIAVLVWTGAFLAWALLKKDLRGPLWNVVKAFLQPAILLPTIGYFAWAAGLVFLAAREGVWNWEVASDTVVWAIASFALLFHSEEVLHGDHFLRRKAAKALQATILVEVFINLVVFPLIVELILVPLVTFLAMTSAFSSLQPQWQEGGRLVDGALAWIGLTLLAYVGIRLATNPGLLNETTGLRFLLPVWLSLGVLPYIYLLALYAGYDSAFRRINFNFNSADPRTRRRAKWALIRRCHLRTGRLGQFRGAWVAGVVESTPDESDDELLDQFAPASDKAEAA